MVCTEPEAAKTALDDATDTFKRFDATPVDITLQFDQPIAFSGAKVLVSHHHGKLLWRVECGDTLDGMQAVTGDTDLRSPCSEVVGASWQSRKAQVWRFIAREDSGDPIVHLGLLTFLGTSKDFVEFELAGEELTSLAITSVDGSAFGMKLSRNSNTKSPSHPIDIIGAIKQAKVEVDTDPFDLGGIEEILDSDHSNGFCRFTQQRSQLNFEFSQPAVLCGAKAQFSNGGPFRWYVECANNVTDLAEHKGSYRCSSVSGCEKTSDLSWTPRKAKVWRLSFQEAAGDRFLHVTDVQLYEPDDLMNFESDTIVQPVVKLPSNAPLRLRAQAGTRSGQWIDVTQYCRWNSSDKNILSVGPSGEGILNRPGNVELSVQMGALSSSKLQVDVPSTSDLIVHCIERQPRYSRYFPEYKKQVFDEGFANQKASFVVSESTPQDSQRWPKAGQTVKYIARVFNRGNIEIKDARIRWFIDGDVVETRPLPGIRPGEYGTSSIQTTWKNKSQEIRFVVGNRSDATPENNQLSRASDALEFLFIVEEGFYRKFAALTVKDSHHQTDSIAWWIQRHVQRFNEMCREKNCRQRVAAGLLVYVPNGRKDPPENFLAGFDGRFPPRFIADNNDWRSSSVYYQAKDDIDYGFIHECAHQLGLIDLYQLNLKPTQNLVNQKGYRVAPSVMNDCARTLSTHSAKALDAWYGRRRGYYGQYLYDLPNNISLVLRDKSGTIIPNAKVNVYQKVDIPGQGVQLAPTPKFRGSTNSEGVFRLPNSLVKVEQFRAPPMDNYLKPNPFGPLACVGTNGLLMIECETSTTESKKIHGWFSVIDANLAYWSGQTNNALIECVVTP